MSYLTIYLIFAVATAITALIQICKPGLKQLAQHQPYHNMVDNEWLTYLTFFIISIIIAPMLFILMLVPSVYEEMVEGFTNGALD